MVLPTRVNFIPFIAVAVLAQLLCLQSSDFTAISIPGAAGVAAAFVPTSSTRTCTYSNGCTYNSIILPRQQGQQRRRRLLSTTTFGKKTDSQLQRQREQSFSLLAQNKNDNDDYDDDDEDDDDEETPPQTGMNEAFEQFNALDSLFEDDNDKSKQGSSSSKVKLDDDSKAALSDAERASMEQEAQLFQKLLQDSESQDETELYSDVMKDMGGTPKNEQDRNAKNKKKEPSVVVQDVFKANALGNMENIPDSVEDKEQFLNKAIQEALEEAKSMSQTPEGKKKISDSILDDEELMKEIEDIFEQGNEKLLASLEEIRQEQKALAKTSAEQSAKVRQDQMDDEAARLAAAEASMNKQLQRVNQETKEVERAVEDLKRAQQEMDKDPLLRLTGKKNVLKPAALAGVLLFSVRSILELVAMGGGGAAADSEAHLMAALIQGAVALVCGIFLIVF